MVQQITLSLPPFKRGFHLITHHIINALGPLPKVGILTLFIQHTSAGLSINENADPTVRLDFETVFNRLVPENERYAHEDEGMDDLPAHIKTSLTGTSIAVPITDGKLNLGIWQGIYLCEFRNYGGSRSIIATILC